MFRSLIAALPLVLSVTTIARAVQVEDDFEAALKATPARSAPAPVARAAPAAKASGQGRQRLPLASVGTVPVEWRRPLAGRADLARAEQAAWAGTVDPAAYVVQQAGEIPMLAGSRPLRCDNNGLRADYSFGAETSPDMRKAITAITIGDTGDPLAMAKAANVHLHADKIPATRARLAEAERFLRERGFVRFGMDVWRRRNAAVGRVTMDITIHASPWFLARDCAPYGVAVPAGPWFSVTLAYPDPDWTDGAR